MRNSNENTIEEEIRYMPICHISKSAKYHDWRLSYEGKYVNLPDDFNEKKPISTDDVIATVMALKEINSPEDFINSESRVLFPRNRGWYSIDHQF